MVAAVKTMNAQPTRALAPDLARGAMLALIAVANVSWYLWQAPTWPGSLHPTDGSTVDRAVQGVVITCVDGRVYPMFAFLFGYGMVQFARARTAAADSGREIERLLTRRHWGMVGIGLAHAVLLWGGDIVAAYGAAALVLMLAWRTRSRVLLSWCVGIVAALLVIAAMTGLGTWLSGADGTHDAGDLVSSPGNGLTARAVNAEPSYLGAVRLRLELAEPVYAVAQGLVPGVVPVCILLGWVAGRRRVIEDVETHRRLLRRVAGGGIALGWAGGLPLALTHLGVWTAPRSVWWVLYLPHLLTGMAAGLGYVALFALVAGRRRGRPWWGPWVGAAGRRSLSCYLFQSFVFAPLLSAWGLGLGGRIGTAVAVTIALGTWALSVLLAAVLERAGWRGPFEVLLRRITYAPGLIPTRSSRAACS